MRHSLPVVTRDDLAKWGYCIDPENPTLVIPAPKVQIPDIGDLARWADAELCRQLDDPAYRGRPTKAGSRSLGGTANV